MLSWSPRLTLPLMLLSLASPAVAAADESGADPAEFDPPRPVLSDSVPLAASPPSRPTDPGPVWPSYVLEPGPRLERVAYVIHPSRVQALLLAAGPELDACRLATDVERDEGARLATEVERLTQELAAARAVPAGGPTAGGRGEGADWAGRLSWGAAGMGAGVVVGAVLVVVFAGMGG